MKKDERAIKRYLQEILSLDPGEEEKIFSLRAAFLGKAPAPSSDFPKRWDLFRQKISEVRDHFWEEEPERLREDLQFLKDQKLPLNQLTDQLERVFKKREELKGLYEKGGNPNFLKAFQDLLVSSPQGRITIKRQVEDAMKKVDLKKEIRQTVSLIAREAPGLYKVERKWLHSLQPPGLLAEFVDIFNVIKSITLWVLLFSIVIGLLKLLIFLFELVFNG